MGLLLIAASGCEVLVRPPQPLLIAPPNPATPRAEARVQTEFEFAAGTRLVGAPQLIFTRYEDTFADIARTYNLGFEELKQANPGINPWLPGADSVVYLPTHYILPDVAHEGVVLNLASLR